MAKLTKRMRVIREKVDATKQYDINEAIALLKELATAKFVESVDVAVNLGIDARKSDQNVRGATVLPHGTGRSVRVAVFTQGANAEAAKAAGAELVGMEDLADQIKKGEMNFDVVIASPDAMRVVGQLGQVLGFVPFFVEHQGVNAFFHQHPGKFNVATTSCCKIHQGCPATIPFGVGISTFFKQQAYGVSGLGGISCIACCEHQRRSTFFILSVDISTFFNQQTGGVGFTVHRSKH